MIFSTISKPLFQSRFRFCNTHSYPQIREDPPQERKKGKTVPFPNFPADCRSQQVLRSPCMHYTDMANLASNQKMPRFEFSDSFAFFFRYYLLFSALSCFTGTRCAIRTAKPDPNTILMPNFPLHASARKPYLKGQAADLLVQSALGAAVRRAVREKPVRPHAITPISSPARAQASRGRFDSYEPKNLPQITICIEFRVCWITVTQAYHA